MPGFGPPVAKHVAGTPANADPAANTSGYSASSSCVVMAPEDTPVTNTREVSVR